MKKELLQQLIMASRYMLLGVFMQTLMTGLLLASDTDAQSVKSVRDVYVVPDKNGQTLISLIKLIESETDYSFSYYQSEINLNKQLKLKYRKQSVYDLLMEVSAQTGLSFRQINNVINVKVKKDGHKTKDVEIIKIALTVSGTVNDPNGGPLPGVNVVVKNTTVGTVTGVDGKYSLSVPDEETILVFSSIGFMPQEVSVNGRNVIDIIMREDVQSLQEIIVVGYGTQATREITGAVESVDSEDLEDAPVAQVGQMLQGKMSGVRINQTTGRPGEGMKFQIRGAASITAGSDPLYVIDGMPISGDISNLNPSEIESISVLKDAAATSLYGSRAANGVVLIQTKTATSGKTKVDFTTYIGSERIPENRRLKMMNATQYAQFQKEVAELNGREVNPIFQNPEQYGEGTDWYDEITQTGAVQSYNLTVSTGMDKFTTSVTAGYFNEKGVVKETGYQRFSLRMNSRFQPTEKLSIGFNVAPTYATNTNYSSDGNPYGSGNIVSSALITTPLVSPYNADGSLALTASDPATFGNPNWLRVAEDIVYDDQEETLLSNAFVEYEIIDGLKIKSTANIQLGNSKLFQFSPSTVGTLFSPPPKIPSGSENTYSFNNWVNENTLNYQKNIGEHSLELLAGFTAQRYKGEGTNITATNYADDKVQAVSAASQIAVSSDVQEWSLLSFLARLNYNYKGKYLLGASIRRDGSSRFGPDSRWGNFPSASIGWIISEEGFWNVEPISFFKLRASYGVTGNFNIGNYTFRSTVSPAFYAYGNSLYQGRAVNNLGDQGLGWERNKQFNIGGDVYLFNDRIQLSYNYYTRNTSDLLFNVAVPRSSGFSNLQTNIGELKFWGHEFTLNTYNIERGNLSWSTNFNISFDRNQTISLDTEEGTLFHGGTSYSFRSHITQVGQPIAQFYGAIQDGVYVNQQDFDNSPKHASSQVGTIKFRDLNGDGVITFPEDYTTIGNPWPDFIFGMTNNINFWNFDASVTLVGSYGNQILAHHENWTTNLDGVFNVLEEVKDRWKSPEDPGEGKYGSTQQGTTFLERDRWHSRFIKDGSYLSFRNITLGYTLPLHEDSRIRRVRFYGSIQNALILTKYPGPNPEVNTRSDASGSTPGFDDNSYPVPRTISFGVNLGI